jgi:hypothetical protein
MQKRIELLVSDQNKPKNKKKETFEFNMETYKLVKSRDGMRTCYGTEGKFNTSNKRTSKFPSMKDIILRAEELLEEHRKHKKDYVGYQIVDVHTELATNHTVLKRKRVY